MQRRNPEMYLVGYAMARSGMNGQPPDWLGVHSWNDAYDLFFPVHGEGRSKETFRNSLKNVRDSFDGFFQNGRVGWRQSSKIERPPAPNKQVEKTVQQWASASDAELRDTTLGLIVGNLSDGDESGLPDSATSAPDLVGIDDDTDARRKVLAEVARRQGQRAFRRRLLKAYGGVCAISGCAVLEVLEAAHILPYTGPHRNVVTNGLILRADLHTLYDLRLLIINPDDMTVRVAEALDNSPYACFDKKPLRLPTDKASWPNSAALKRVASVGKAPS